MLKMFAISLVAAMVLSGCGGSKQDYAYNEKTASVFLSHMERVDDEQKQVSAGEVSQPEGMFLESELGNIDTSIRNAKEAITSLDEIPRSDKADAFDAEVKKYLNMTADEYYPAMKELVQAKDEAAKTAATAKLTGIHQKLEVQVAKTLEVQKTFLDAAGIPHGK